MACLGRARVMESVLFRSRTLAVPEMVGTVAIVQPMPEHLQPDVDHRCKPDNRLVQVR